MNFSRFQQIPLSLIVYLCKKHVTAFCQKPSCQPNTLWRIHNNIGFQEMKMLLDSLIFSNFNYCPFVWHFCPAPLSQKKDKIQESALSLYFMHSYFKKKTTNHLAFNRVKTTMFGEKSLRALDLKLEDVKDLTSTRKPIFLSEPQFS